jgi:hypothetical protein
LAIETATEAQTTMKLCFPQRRTNLSQALHLQCGTQYYKKLFPKLSKDNTVKIILRLIKRLSPPANDEPNPTLEVQHAVGHQFSVNCFQNKKFSESNEIRSLKEKLETAINGRLSSVPARKMVKA